MPGGNHSEAGLFSVFERIVLTCGLGVMGASFLTPWACLSSISKLVNPIARSFWQKALDAVLSWLPPGIGNAADILFPLFALAIVVVVFCELGRRPHVVAHAIIWMVGIQLVMLGLVTPVWLVHYAKYVVMQSHNPTIYEAWNHLYIIPYALTFIHVCAAGEFLGLVQRRTLRGRWWVAIDEGVAAVRQEIRRQHLMMAAAGPRMPVSYSVAQVLAQTVTASWALLSIAGTVDRVWRDGTQRELEAPSLTAVAPHGKTMIDTRGRVIMTYVDLKVTAEGQVYLDGEAFDSPTSKDLPRLELRLREVMLGAGRGLSVSLQVESAVRHERLVDVLCVTNRVGVPVVFAD